MFPPKTFHKNLRWHCPVCFTLRIPRGKDWALPCLHCQGEFLPILLHAVPENIPDKHCEVLRALPRKKEGLIVRMEWMLRKRSVPPFYYKAHSSGYRFLHSKEVRAR